jgi:hypothetical protein
VRDELAGVPARRTQQPVPFASMLTSTAVAFMLVVPVASPITMMVMPPVTAMPVVMVLRAVSKIDMPR